MPTTMDRIRSLGTAYTRVRRTSRFGWVLRYLTIAVGFLVTAAGVITIPYPGPGWAIVFLGLLILSQELEWAARLRKWIMSRLNSMYSDYIDGNRLAQFALAVGTCAVVLLTLWVTGALDLAQGWVGLDYGWLDSPLG
ncbi:TIGR02611 family protein [Gordonia sp. PS3]|uniref:TIGR02611 family protein n=1 Tax=unclassified Gordonia (in: high G+C Gram-positive bacteria) TaxID=2657482 RepID=UPI0007860DB9|nr:TIGR02611 family protein [Gordonia sp. QH-12]